MAKYYDVPDFPGVPPLLRDPKAAAIGFAAGAITSFVSPVIGAAKSIIGSVTGSLDTMLGGGDDISGTADAPTSWGLFDDQGQQVIFPDTFLGIEYRNSRRISNYPLEQGAFESYNKVNDPFDVVVGMACGGDVAKRTDFLATCEALANDLNLYTLVTPEAVYESVNLERYDFARKQHNGATLITVNFYFKEIRINTKSEYTNTPEDSTSVEAAQAATTVQTSDTGGGAQLDPSDVQNPASASPQAQGQTQATPATAQEAAPAPTKAVDPAAAGSTAIDRPPSAGPLTKLPPGYTQSPETGVIRDAGGNVDREMTINQGTSYIGDKK